MFSPQAAPLAHKRGRSVISSDSSSQGCIAARGRKREQDGNEGSHLKTTANAREQKTHTCCSAAAKSAFFSPPQLSIYWSCAGTSRDRVDVYSPSKLMLATLVYLLSPALSVTALKSIVTASLDGVVRTLWIEGKKTQRPVRVDEVT